MGPGLRRRCVGIPAGARVPQHAPRLAAPDPAGSLPRASDRSADRLVLAWYHGDRGQRHVTRSELAILTLLFLLGGGVFWYYQRTSETATVDRHAVRRAPPALATDASIAVLPFVDMSADKDQEYFSDGMSEELLNLLAKVPELRVIARTSSFSFKGKDVGHRRDRTTAQCRPRARRQRAQVRRQAAHHRAADPRVRQLAPVVARPTTATADRHLRGAGRDRGSGGRGAAGDELAGAQPGSGIQAARERGRLQPDVFKVNTSHDKGTPEGNKAARESLFKRSLEVDLAN